MAGNSRTKLEKSIIAKRRMRRVGQPKSSPRKLYSKRPSNGLWRKNAPEKLFCEFADGNEFSVTKRGWPDFICEDEEGIFFVEVKPVGTRLKASQKRIMGCLSAAGFRCFVWRPGDSELKSW